jgi:hypothetical protein
MASPVASHTSAVTIVATITLKIILQVFYQINATIVFIRANNLSIKIRRKNISTVVALTCLLRTRNFLATI